MRAGIRGLDIYDLTCKYNCEGVLNPYSYLDSLTPKEDCLLDILEYGVGALEDSESVEQTDTWENFIKEVMDMLTEV